jgi:predicted DNA-binding transcriptional regulator AlpA
VAFDQPPLSGGTSKDHGGTIMPDPLAGLPPRFLRTPEAARFLGLSGRTLEKHRTYGTGPKYRKIGGRVVYALDDLKAWADPRCENLDLRFGRWNGSPRQARRHTGSPQRQSAPPLSAQARCPTS